MKKNSLILILLTSLNVVAQKKAEIFFKDFVECFYSKKTTECIYIYNRPNGSKIAELSPLTDPYCWYKFAISESKNDWLKIENVIVLPSCEENELNNDIGKYKNKWVLAKNMIIDIDSFGEPKISCLSNKNDRGFEEIGYRFYKRPNSDSEIAFCIKGYIASELLAVNGTWGKLKIIHNDKLYIGWIQKKYQCAYPWTTCPVWD